MARDPALLLLNSVLGVCWAVFAPAFPWLYHWLHKPSTETEGRIVLRQAV